MAIDDLENRLAEVHRKTRAVQLTNARTLPKFLYHYSSQSGIEGILRSSVLWATDFRDLEDKEELHYGKELVISALESRRRINTNPNIDRFLQAALERPHSQGWLETPITLTDGFDENSGQNITYDDYLDGFIVCFCADPASPTQWEDYGDKSHGFAVGIDAHLIDPSKSLTPYYVDQVLYDPRHQMEKIDTYLTFFIHQAAVLMQDLQEPRKDYVVRQIHSFMSPYVLWSILTFKQPKYRSENEWRFLYSQWRKKGKVKVQERFNLAGKKMRYIEMHLGGAEKLPLRHLFYGPKLNADQARDRLRELQVNFGYTDSSIIPWREDVERT